MGVSAKGQRPVSNQKLNANLRQFLNGKIDLRTFTTRERASHRFRDVRPHRQLVELSNLNQSLDGIMAPGFFHCEADLFSHSLADWAYMRPLVEVFAGDFINRARKRGVPLFCIEAYRTPAQGALRYPPDVTGQDGIWLAAPHAQGAAVDIIHSVCGFRLSANEWEALAFIGRQSSEFVATAFQKRDFKMTWGPDIGKSPWHWELDDYLEDLNYVEMDDHLTIRKSPHKLRSGGIQGATQDEINQLLEDNGIPF